jgi:hypothetical protein
MQEEELSNLRAEEDSGLSELTSMHTHLFLKFSTGKDGARSGSKWVTWAARRKAKAGDSGIRT